MIVWQVSDLQFNRLVYIKKRQEKKACTERLLSSKNPLNGKAPALKNTKLLLQHVSIQTQHNLQTQSTVMSLVL